LRACRVSSLARADSSCGFPPGGTPARLLQPAALSGLRGERVGRPRRRAETCRPSFAGPPGAEWGSAAFLVRRRLAGARSDQRAG